jgi:hypothetical protein
VHRAQGEGQYRQGHRFPRPGPKKKTKSNPKKATQPKMGERTDN